jgi:hypothetical protein
LIIFDVILLVFRTSRGSGGRGREGSAEPAISQKEAIARFGSEHAYWFYEASSPHLAALLLIIDKTLAVVKRQPETHGFICRSIQQERYYMWVKNLDLHEDARSLTPAEHRDFALAVQARLATFPGPLPLGVFLTQNPEIFESALRNLKPSLSAAFRGCFAAMIPATPIEFVRLVRSLSGFGKIVLSTGTLIEEESEFVCDVPLDTTATVLEQDLPGSSRLKVDDQKEDRRFYLSRPPEGQSSSLSASSSSSLSAIDQVRAYGGTLYLAAGDPKRQRVLHELVSFPSMDEMPQAEERRARQEHDALVARGLAKGAATIVGEATFTDALGTEFGLGYKARALERQSKESFADGYSQGAVDAAKRIEQEFGMYSDLLRQGPNISGGELVKVGQILSMQPNAVAHEEDGEESGCRQSALKWLLEEEAAVMKAVSASCVATSKKTPANLEEIAALDNGFWRKTLLAFFEPRTEIIGQAVQKARDDLRNKLPSHLKSAYCELKKIVIPRSHSVRQPRKILVQSSATHRPASVVIKCPVIPSRGQTTKAAHDLLEGDPGPPAPGAPVWTLKDLLAHRLALKKLRSLTKH